MNKNIQRITMDQSSREGPVGPTSPLAKASLDTNLEEGKSSWGI